MRSRFDFFVSLTHETTWKDLDELVVDAEDVVKNERAEWVVFYCYGNLKTFARVNWD